MKVTEHLEGLSQARPCPSTSTTPPLDTPNPVLLGCLHSNILLALTHVIRMGIILVRGQMDGALLGQYHQRYQDLPMVERRHLHCNNRAAEVLWALHPL